MRTEFGSWNRCGPPVKLQGASKPAPGACRRRRSSPGGADCYRWCWEYSQAVIDDQCRPRREYQRLGGHRHHGGSRGDCARDDRTDPCETRMWRRRSSKQRLALFSSVLVLTLVGTLVTALPLSWAVEPHSVLLGKGRMNGLQWQIELHRDSHSRLACLDLAVELPIQTDGRPSFFEVCSSVSAPASIVTYGTQRRGKALTLLAGIVAPKIVRLEFRTSDGSTVVPVMRRLSSHASRRIGLPRLRYIRVAFPGGLCYTRVVGVNKKGQEIYRGAETC
jgi:hypothetical protein